jgi:ubiquinone/menaquinone biosynthesis C-methylase UbiE
MRGSTEGATASREPVKPAESANPPTEGIEETRTAWDRIASGYDRFVTATHLWLGNESLRRVGLQPGMRFLDVAAGSGALSIPAARLGARVLSTDLSPAMIRCLEERARDEGISTLEARVMDGHALDLEDDTFDVSGSQFGVMLFPDLPRGVREMVRVTRPGGRVVLVVFGPPSQVEFLGFFMEAMRVAVPGFMGLPTDPPPLPFQVADPGILAERLADAGLSAVQVETVIETLEFGSGAEMWDWLMNSNPIPGVLVGDTTPDQRATAREALDAMLRERAGGPGPAVLTHPIHIGFGTK